MARLKVSLEEKATAVAEYQRQGIATVAAKKTGFSHQSLLNWAKLNDPEWLQLLQEKRKALGVGFADLTEKLLARALEEHEQLSIKDRNFVSLLGVGAEKMLLLAGQPTQIVETRDDARLADSLTALLERWIAHCQGDELAARSAIAERWPELAAALPPAPPELQVAQGDSGGIIEAEGRVIEARAEEAGTE